MIALRSLEPSTVVPVHYVLERGRQIHEQIRKSFDYVVLCHVIEHIANPIGYINDLARLLTPGGVVFIACPDRRRTPDSSRPPTTITHLLNDYYQGSSYPSLEHILEHARAWLTDRPEINDARQFFELGRSSYESGQADAHCHVWTDEEFFEQMEYLTRGGFLEGLEVAFKGHNNPAFNEFFLGFRLRI